MRMGSMSEKVIYGQFFEDVKYKYANMDDFIWGEELVRYKLKLYKDKTNKIPELPKIKQGLINVGIIAINRNKAGMISVGQTKFDTVNEIIYIKEELFNGFWRLLRNSIIVGIENNPEICETRGISEPEDVLILDLLRQGTKEPYVNGGVIKYRKAELSRAERELRSIRQSKMDNQKLIYAYSKYGGFVHDKYCDEVNKIADSAFCASNELPDGYDFCGKCRRTNLIRRGCSPITKQIPICDRFFKENHVSTRVIESAVDAGITFHATDLSYLKVIGSEDCWIIKITKNGPILLHNNYVKTSDKERYITDGYHNQGLNGYSVSNMLKYIQAYTWEKHLEGETYKKAQEEARILAEQLMETTTKKNIWNRIIDYIKSSLKKIKKTQR